MVDRWPHVQMIVHVRQNYFLSRLPKEIRESVMANGTSRLIEQLRVNEIVAVRKNQKTTKSSPHIHLSACVSEFAFPRPGGLHFGAVCNTSSDVLSCHCTTSSGLFPCCFV